MSRADALRAGGRASAPVIVGIVPFGLVAGAAAIAAGLSLLQAVGLSVVVFAGASQLAMIDLLAREASLVVVVGTALVINARLVMYSASIAPDLLDVKLRVRALLAYVLTDQAYALSVTRYREGLDETDQRLWFYVGTAVPLWVAWQIATIAGAVVGAQLPTWLPLGFAVPLVFLALLAPAVQDRPSAAAAIAGGAIATLGIGLPYNLGLLAGAVVGIAVGTGLALNEPTSAEAPA